MPLSHNQVRQQYVLGIRSLIEQARIYLDNDELLYIFEQILYEESQ